MDENTIGVFRITDVLNRTPCGKHKMPKGIPCWHLRSNKGSYLPAICNKRAKEAGFVGHITPKSMTSTSKARRQRG